MFREALIRFRIRHRLLSRAEVAAFVRRELVWFGVDVRHITDEEFYEGVCALGEIICGMGVSFEEAATSLQRLASELPTLDPA